MGVDSERGDSTESSRGSIWRKHGWPFRRGRFLIWIFAIFVLPHLVGLLLTLPPFEFDLPPIADDAELELYVVIHDHHTDLIVEQPEGFALGPKGKERAKYLEYAWGDREWFAMDNKAPLSAINTILLPSGSVVYLDGLNDPVKQTSSSATLYRTTLNASEARALFASLEGAFSRDTDASRFAPVEHKRAMRGAFYPGREFYLIWYDCNAWTVQMLESTGMDTSSVFVFTARNVELRLPERFEKVKRE